MKKKQQENAITKSIIVFNQQFLNDDANSLNQTNSSSSKIFIKHSGDILLFVRGWCVCVCARSILSSKIAFFDRRRKTPMYSFLFVLCVGIFFSVDVIHDSFVCIYIACNIVGVKAQEINGSNHVMCCNAHGFQSVFVERGAYNGTNIKMNQER